MHQGNWGKWGYIAHYVLQRRYHESVSNVRSAVVSSASGVVFSTFEASWDVPIGHVTNIVGGPGRYNVSIFGAIVVITPLCIS